MTMTILTAKELIVKRIKELESELQIAKSNHDFELINSIKSELRELYKLRKKQKYYKKPPEKISIKGF